ncbi:uncharacterized protein LOC127437016 isoform X5 [Myxocyprinus asiaticus]|uniref:uncharacterized protein LOC127437016 isoform X5 n=1 Tax=Myxocyprinus asiaticus TaxID=70543 RepID=UPI00222301B9|nr:uncharacterized protein LOC127437016 isoform X5 [Myxocyprinus asiaticus]
MESVLPLSSLRLLVPPLRLTSALMWQVVQDQNVEQFGKLEEFVSVMTNLMPELLSKRQRATLIVGLRAKMILEMCRGELPVDVQTVKSHIHRLQTTDLLKLYKPDVEVSSLAPGHLYQAVFGKKAQRIIRDSRLQPPEPWAALTATIRQVVLQHQDLHQPTS